MSLLGRELTSEERDRLERIVRSRTIEVRLAERANIVLAASEAHRLLELSRSLKKDKDTIHLWVDRFLERGVEGLHDLPRSGCPNTYAPEVKAQVVLTALTPPSKLGMPFNSWTHDRLTAYMHEQKNIPISRTRIAHILRTEGLRWHHHEGWYGERVDPEFAEKRGRSSGLTVKPKRMR